MGGGGEAFKGFTFVVFNIHKIRRRGVEGEHSSFTQLL